MVPTAKRAGRELHRNPDGHRRSVGQVRPDRTVSQVRAMTPWNPTKYMLAFDFTDGSVFVGETVDPKTYIKGLMRGWRSKELPVVRVVSQYVDFDHGRGFDLHSKYVARYRAMLAGKRIRATGLGQDGLPVVYDSSTLTYRPDVIEKAGCSQWGYGDLLLIDGVTAKPKDSPAPAPQRRLGWVIAEGGLALTAGVTLYIFGRFHPIFGRARSAR